MKKLLSLLSSMTVAASAAMAVVSCSVPSTPITVSFGKGPIDDKGHYTVNDGGKQSDQYSMSDIAASMLGNYTGGQEIGTLNFNNLNRGLLSLLSFNQSMIVKTQKNYSDVAAHRNLWQGRDAKDLEDIPEDHTVEQVADVPSVDGIKFGGVDSDKYYDGFTNTQISSLKGLQDLAHFKGEIKDAKLQNQQNAAQGIFGKSIDDDNAGNNFMKVLLNAPGNPSFTKINYGFDTKSMTVYNPKSSLVDVFNDTEKVEDNSVMKLEPGQDYLDLNTNVVDKADEKDSTLHESDKKINERKIVDPYGALLLPMKDSTVDIESTQAHVLNTTYTDANKTDKKKKQVISGTISDGSNSDLYVAKTESDAKYSYAFATNKFIAKDVQPLKITYTYDTKIDKDAKPIKGNIEYTVDFTVNNLKAIFMPHIYDVNTFKPVSAETDKDGNTKVNFNMTKKSYDDATKEGSKLAGKYQIKIDEKRVDISDVKPDDVISTTFKADENSQHSIDIDGRQYSFTVNYPAKDQKSATVKFTTEAAVWAFVGYKFFNNQAAKDEYKDSKAFTGEQSLVDEDDKQKEFASEMVHNYKDLLIAGEDNKLDIKINKVENDANNQ